MAMAMAMAILVFLMAARSAQSLSMTVYRTECVQENVQYDGDTVSGNFVVMDHELFWGSDHSGIDFVVTSAAGNVVYSVKGTAGDTFKFRAPKSGLYKFCFHNTAPSPETVDFYIHSGHIPSDHDLAKDEHVNPIKVKIAELSESLEAVTAEQHYLKARMDRHHRTTVSTQMRLINYTIGECIVLAVTSLIQVILIQRRFEKQGEV